jgi:dTDP-4-amino-4,6-dideoxygalactose transaminase
MDAIFAIAREYDLAIVEDAAHALPARYHGQLIGSDAMSARSGLPRTLTAFSFYATKNLTTAEGGMLVGQPDCVDEARIWSLHGMSRDAYDRYTAAGSWYYEVTRPGFKYNLTDLQASLGLHQLRKLCQFQARRREIVATYNAAFSGVEQLELPVEKSEVEHAWHLYVVRLNLDRLSIGRGQFIDELRARNIGTSVHFIPIHHHPYYRRKYGFRPEHFPIATREYRRLVSLPLWPGMTDRDVQDVIEAVFDVVERYRTSR